jgi:hypothetical protein
VIAVVTELQSLFQRLPSLVGFSVQDQTTLSAERMGAAMDQELTIADVSVQPWAGVEASPELCSEIAATLLELLEEYPAARTLLRGQTFARRFH